MPVIVDEHAQYLNEGGKPLVNGKLFFGIVNQDPKLNPAPIFADRDLTIPIPNPQSLDTFGRTVNKVYLSGRYSIKLEDSNGSQIFQDFDRGEIPATTIITLINVIGIDDITAEAAPTILSYVDKQQYTLTIVNENTGAMTLSVDGLAAVPIKDNGADVVPGQFPANQIITVAYNFLSNIFELVGGVNLSSPPPIGDATPNTIRATTFEGNAGGTTINEFSTDGTLAGNSDDAVPTEQAVKTFVESTNVASQAEMETASDITKKVTPGRQKFHPGSAKAWVLYDNNGTPNIRDSYNISSVTDQGLGRFQVIFDTDFSNTNYSIGTCVGGAATNGGFVIKEQITGAGPGTTLRQVGAINMTNIDQGNSTFDSDLNSCIFFGDQ